MKLYTSLILVLLSVLLLTGCQEAKPFCPTGTSTPVNLSLPPDELPTPTPASGPFQVMIGRKEVQVDKVVEGPLCVDDWEGTVYVTCDVQVYPWQESPTFLKDCQLDIDPNAVVYVAYHNNTAYYKGCTCHTTGETPEP